VEAGKGEALYRHGSVHASYFHAWFPSHPRRGRLAGAEPVLGRAGRAFMIHATMSDSFLPRGLAGTHPGRPEKRQVPPCRTGCAPLAGCRTRAQRHLVATGQAWDDEMRERIARHQRDRAERVPGMQTWKRRCSWPRLLAHSSPARWWWWTA
jgi:hypothetical protein